MPNWWLTLRANTANDKITTQAILVCIVIVRICIRRAGTDLKEPVRGPVVMNSSWVQTDWAFDSNRARVVDLLKEINIATCNTFPVRGTGDWNRIAVHIAHVNIREMYPASFYFAPIDIQIGAHIDPPSPTARKPELGRGS